MTSVVTQVPKISNRMAFERKLSLTWVIRRIKEAQLYEG
ncbi:unnamed protein product [Taenia asiatica]|uniref:Transcriptional regulator n=1 Tax=Taenia asiatica TaxID=60517 RepID=A0A0R3WDF2_TAEAS|nr:unnamed protein product [Taenia asiatica]